MFAVMEYADSLLLEIAVIGGINVYKFLRIPVDEREPGALDLDHQAVSFLKGMGDIGNGPFDRLHLAGSKGNRFFEAFAEAAAHDLGMYQHLVAAHGIGWGIVVAAH